MIELTLWIICALFLLVGGWSVFMLILIALVEMVKALGPQHRLPVRYQ